MTKYEILEGLNETSFDKTVSDFILSCRSLSLSLSNSCYQSDLLSYWQRKQVEETVEYLEKFMSCMRNWTYKGENPGQLNLPGLDK